MLKAVEYGADTSLETRLAALEAAVALLLADHDERETLYTLAAETMPHR